MFSKLDLAHAYRQITLDDALRKVVVINTQKGLPIYCHLVCLPILGEYKIYCLCLLVGNHGGDPQRHSEGLDDILVIGKTDEEHLQRLDTVLQCLEDAGMRLKQKKCAFMVEYLGHNISRDGLRTTNEKVCTVTDTPAPGV